MPMTSLQHANKPQAPAVMPFGGFCLQRNCACGNHTSKVGECASCDQHPPGLQRSLNVGASNDPYELEADQIAAQVLASPARRVSNAAPRIGRLNQTSGLSQTAPASVDRVLSSPGSPLDSALRQDMESRFGHDFSKVRVHSSATAESSASELNAQAYTVGHHIVFGSGRFAPGTHDGQRLIAHELTHVIQQTGPGPAWMPQSMTARSVSTNEGGPGADVASASHQVLQRFPGDGMVPPGDCSWTTYAILRAAVEIAKAAVSALGACSPTKTLDGCIALKMTIAAIAAEIAARLAIMNTCFKGGDGDHRIQVQDKINMLNRCWRHFVNGDCANKIAAAEAAAAAAAAAALAQAEAEAAEAAEALEVAAEAGAAVEEGVTALEVLEVVGAILLAL
jgi:Domain of unknown function (DUF4157)/Novel toxin 16